MGSKIHHRLEAGSIEAQTNLLDPDSPDFSFVINTNPMPSEPWVNPQRARIRSDPLLRS
jgi:hypothetical protein